MWILSKLSAHLAVACALGNVEEVLQQVGLLLLKELLAGRVQVCLDRLVRIEGADIHLAHLHAKSAICENQVSACP